jgi:hypothetical protein
VSAQPLYSIDPHIWISPRDLVQLLQIALERTPLHFEVLYGISANRLRWWSLERARGLGYRPADGIGVADLLQGGSFAAQGFAGEIARL